MEMAWQGIDYRLVRGCGLRLWGWDGLMVGWAGGEVLRSLLSKCCWRGTCVCGFIVVHRKSSALGL